MEKDRFPSVFRFLAAIALFLFSSASSPASDGARGGGNASWIEPGVDRPGQDFRILWIRGGVEPCQEACAQNPLCKAYTYVKPGVPGRMEGCWLKDGAAPPVMDDCCISGVKTGEAFTSVLREKTLPEDRVVPALPDPTATGVSVESSSGISEAPSQETPRTGRGSREAAGIHYSAIPRAPAGTGRGRSSPVGIPPPPARGTGWKSAVGADFAASPPVETSRANPVPGPQRTPATGAGTRKTGALHFAATPPVEPSMIQVVSDTGTATREIRGADFRAEPAKR